MKPADTYSHALYALPHLFLETTPFVPLLLPIASPPSPCPSLSIYINMYTISSRNSPTTGPFYQTTAAMAANYPHFTSHHHHPYPQPPPPWPPAAAGEREHLFEKPLTPSDVGKLNRLVIPKQHAETHFPLDGESGEKGLILCFEDEAGKHWSFRYSYWASSQSYVLTKGWSRYVKEKHLDAGDVVVFQRLRSDADRLYIACKRRTDADADAPAPPPARWDEAASTSRTVRLFGVDMEYGHVPGSPSVAQRQEARRRELQLLPCADADPTPRCN